MVLLQRATLDAADAFLQNQAAGGALVPDETTQTSTRRVITVLLLFIRRPRRSVTDLEQTRRRGSRFSEPVPVTGAAGGTRSVGSLPACPGWILVPFVSRQSQSGLKEMVACFVVVFNAVFVTDAMFFMVWIKDFFLKVKIPLLFSSLKKRFRIGVHLSDRGCKSWLCGGFLW